MDSITPAGATLDQQPRAQGAAGTSRQDTLEETAPSAKRSVWRHIRRDVLLLGAGSVIVTLAQLCFRGILITTLIPREYGRVSLILSVYNTIWIIGASGLPSAVSRHIAIIAPADDSAIIASALRAALAPIAIAATTMAVVSGVLLHSWLACVLAAVGLTGLIYSLLAMGILRGRRRIGAAASIMPIAGIAEVAPLAILWLTGTITPLSAFGVFCLGNLVGCVTGLTLVRRTAPQRQKERPEGAPTIPTARELLGLSSWLGVATVGVAALPLVVRVAASLDSYAMVATVDIALLLLTIPQRIGTLILIAVVPHAARGIDRSEGSPTISLRESLIVLMPFAIAAAVVAFSPLLGWVFDFLGRPVYASSAGLFALALLAGPARILYGLVEGVLIAHLQGRFLAVMVLSISAIASGLIFTAAALGSTTLAFAVFVTAFWAICLFGRARVARLA